MNDLFYTTLGGFTLLILAEVIFWIGLGTVITRWVRGYKAQEIDEE